MVAPFRGLVGAEESEPALEPPARDGYSAHRRALAGLLGIRLTERSGQLPRGPRTSPMGTSTTADYAVNNFGSAFEETALVGDIAEPPLSTDIGEAVIDAARPSVPGVTAPVRDLMVQAFATYAVVSWMWPEDVQTDQITWVTSDKIHFAMIERRQYVSDGGIRIPLESTGTVEVRAVRIVVWQTIRCTASSSHGRTNTRRG